MSKLKNRIGETNRANNGLMMKIIVYHSAADIDVQFEDGTIVSHKTYYHFLKGKIAHPEIHTRSTKCKNKHIGQHNINRAGQMMQIIAYRKSNDIDVQFEDGVVVKCVQYSAFKRGYITHPYIVDRTGETQIATNGMKIKIVACRKAQDIDVQFEDGVVVYHKRYIDFSKGAIRHPEQHPVICRNKKHIGEIRTSVDGVQMQLIEYRNNTDIDVQFEDGYIIRHKKYYAFNHGLIRRHTEVINHVGETRIANNGMQMTIIAYRRSDDLDVQFEDGYIAEHITYANFCIGWIANANFQYKNGNVKSEYLIHTVMICKMAYTYNHLINYYCRCTKCGMQDIMTISEMKAHICNI